MIVYIFKKHFADELQFVHQYAKVRDKYIKIVKLNNRAFAWKVGPECIVRFEWE